MCMCTHTCTQHLLVIPIASSATEQTIDGRTGYEPSRPRIESQLANTHLHLHMNINQTILADPEHTIDERQQARLAASRIPHATPQ